MTRALCNALLCASLLLGACDKGPTNATQPPLPADILLTIDGIDITFGEVEPLVAFISATHPEGGHKTILQVVLEKHTVPLRLAERAFAEPRKVQLQGAEDLCTVATNALELDAQRVATKERKKYARMQPALPVSMFLFDPLTTGGVSPPIAVPRGFIVAAAQDYRPSPLVAEDMVEATQVGFFTHTVGEWRDWIQAEQGRVADKVTYVHPRFREALPTWCKKP